MKTIFIIALTLLSACTHTPQPNDREITGNYQPRQVLQIVVGESSRFQPEEIKRALFNIEGEIEMISHFDLQILDTDTGTTPENAHRCLLVFYGFVDANSPANAFTAGQSRITREPCEIAIVSAATGATTFHDLKEVLRHEIVHALIGNYHNTIDPDSVMTPVFVYGKYRYFTTQDREVLGDVIFQNHNNTTGF